MQKRELFLIIATTLVMGFSLGLLVGGTIIERNFINHAQGQ